MDIVTLLMANKYTKETAEGMGAVKGKNCTIQSKTRIDGGTRLVFAWTKDDGTVQTAALDVMDGKDGNDGFSPTAEITAIDGGHRLTVTDKDGSKSADMMDGKGIRSVAVDADSHLVITYDDGTEYDAGEIAVESAVSGVKGEAETDYRMGNVSISKADIGLGSADNTADKDKPLSDAAKDEFKKYYTKEEIDAMLAGTLQLVSNE